MCSTVGTWLFVLVRFAVIVVEERKFVRLVEERKIPVPAPSVCLYVGVLRGTVNSIQIFVQRDYR